MNIVLFRTIETMFHPYFDERTNQWKFQKTVSEVLSKDIFVTERMIRGFAYELARKKRVALGKNIIRQLEEKSPQLKIDFPRESPIETK